MRVGKSLCDLELRKGSMILVSRGRGTVSPAPPASPHGFVQTSDHDVPWLPPLNPNSSPSPPPTLGHGDTKQMFEIFGTAVEEGGA